MPTVYVACLREQVVEWVLLRQKIAERWKDFAPHELIIGDPETLGRTARAEVITRCDLFILHFSPIGFVNSGIQSDLLEARTNNRVIFVACPTASHLPPELTAYPRLDMTPDGRDVENGLRVFMRRFRTGRHTPREGTPSRVTLFGLVGAALALLLILGALLSQLLTGSFSTMAPPTYGTAYSTQTAGVRELISVPLVISDASGENVGTGTVRVTAPYMIYDDETALIRLELEPELSSQPPGEPGPGASLSDDAQEEVIAAVYQLMGAQLICADGSFLGCDANDEIQRSINTTGNHVWTWILTPLIADGRRDLDLRLYRYLNVNGSEFTELVWSQPLALRVRLVVSRYDASADSSPILLVAFTVTLAAGLGIAYLIARTVKRRLRGAEAARPTVFLSYQHESSTADAWILSKGLAQRGIDVWVDFERIFKGHFQTEIEQAIETCDLFVALLADTSLQSDWVRREITTALEQMRPITCVLKTGVRMDDLLRNQPERFAELREIHHLTLTPPDYDVTIERLARAARQN